VPILLFSVGAALTVCALAPMSSPLSAQAKAAPERPVPLDTFDSVAIKPSALGRVSRITMPADGRFIATNVSLPMLIRFAYQIQNFQIVDSPRWMDAATFDIEATGAREPAPQPRGTPRVRARVRHMLADNFKLKVRRETRDLPMYELVIARSDKRLGPQFRPSTVDCAALARNFGRGAAGAPPSEDLTGCGVRMQPGVVAGGGVRVAELALMLSRLTGRAVEDKTKLSGVYDLHLEFFHELAPQREEPATAGAATGTTLPADGRVEIRQTIFTAIQDQLGLRLQPTRGPVDVLVITNVEQPEP
jgi:uncharacterized protein (TIGR03435 family)